MSVFTAAELAYLSGQRLARLATVDRSGTPHVVPIGFRMGGATDTIEIGGRHMGSSKKVRDVRATGRAAVVVDDVASTDPWQVRGLEIRGRARVIEPDPDDIHATFIRIVPERIASWGLDDPDPFVRNARTVVVADPDGGTPERSERDWNAEIVAHFRATGGDVPAPYPDPPPMLLIHTIGARSGRAHLVPMRGLVEGPTRYIFATAHGSARNPDWYHNLIAHPDIEIEQGTERIPVRATEVTGDDRDAVLARWVERVPLIADTLAKTSRRVPVIRLDQRVPGQRGDETTS